MKETAPSYNGYTLSDLVIKLGLNEDEAASIWRSWHHQPPTEPEELARYNNQSKRFETGMEGLNYDLSTGVINEEQYYQKIEKLTRDIYGEE